MTALDISRPAFSRGTSPRVATAKRVSRETVVCEACGCRLTTREPATDPVGARSWYHFSGVNDRDGRGCSVACVNAVHRIA